MTQFALMKGRKTTENSRYLDAFPVNMMPIPEQAPNASGYLRSFRGIEPLFNCDGPSYAATYNDLMGKEYRILGKKLYEDETIVANLAAPHMANLCHSRYSQAFVDNGLLKFYRDNKVHVLTNWSRDEKIKGQPGTSYDLTGVIDVDRHQGRYVWINKSRFGCTALENEQRPDYVAPFYSPESDPDNNKAIRSCFGKYVAIFGRHTTEFFSLTGDANNIYMPQKNMETQCGIVSTPAVCLFGNGFAAVGSSKNESLSIVMIMPGKHEKISTATVDNLLNKYKESELANVLVEAHTIDNQPLLFVHLPQETLVYEMQQNTWFTLKSQTTQSGPYTGRHILYNHELGLTIGDSQQGRVGLLTEKVASQYDEQVEHLLYTPVIRVNPNRGLVPLFDLSFDSIDGYDAKAQRLFLSVTYDGAHYDTEKIIEFTEPQRFNNRILYSNVGAVEDTIGFRLRWLTKDNVSISGFNVRIGYA